MLEVFVHYFRLENQYTVVKTVVLLNDLVVEGAPRSAEIGLGLGTWSTLSGPRHAFPTLGSMLQSGNTHRRKTVCLYWQQRCYTNPDSCSIISKQMKQFLKISHILHVFTISNHIF